MDRTVAALILAGGEASRLGFVDKPLLPLGGQPMIAHILQRLSAAHGRIAVSANGDPSRFARFGCPVLPDAAGSVRRGPLAGILAGLRWAEQAGAETMLTVPGDAPFIPADLAARLTPGPACAASGGRRHPTVALWTLPLAARLAAHLASLERAPRRVCSVADFGAMIGMRQVTFEDDTDPFLNVNTPEDLARAQARLAC